MYEIKFLTRTLFYKFFLCYFGLCLCLVKCESNLTASLDAVEMPLDKTYEQYDDSSDSDHALFYGNNFRVYQPDENIEKGIRKLDTSVEVEKDENDTKLSPNITANVTADMAPSLSVYDSFEKFESSNEDLTDPKDTVGVFENSETNNNANISGTLVTKLIPEILKLNGRMVVSSTEEIADESSYSREISQVKTKDKSVVQKLLPRRTRQESRTEPEIVSSSLAISNGTSRLEDIFDLYNPYRLADIWTTNEEIDKLSLACHNQMELFLTALQHRDSWALKMWDASGHYGGSYFWGNPYWMGSRTLCREISTSDDNIPFEVEFSVAKINVSLNLPEVRKYSRSQHIGICLPLMCSKEDIHVMILQSILSSDASNDRVADIIRIKSHEDYYYMTQDKTFWLVVISSLFVATLLIIGTILDLRIMEKKKFSRGAIISKNFKYDNYTYAVNPPIQPYTDNGKMEVDSTITEGSNGFSGVITPVSEIEEPKYSTWQEIFLSFSIIRNVRQICDSTIGADTIPIIHGLRSISMAWVILGHTCIVAFKYSDNMEFRKVAERELLFQTINNAAFTVDTFFFISGLLVSFLYFRTMAKVNVNKITKTTGFLSNCIEFIGLLGYRFCRLTIPYIFTLELVEVSMKWFYYNSVFDPPADDHINCPNYWWRNLLYINTLFPVKDMCMLWSWYLADDTQFYILGIILLILAVRHFRAASISVVALLVISWCTTGYIAYLNNHMPNVDDPLALFDKIYDKPWTRFGPYLIGMIVGYILYKTNCKIAMTKAAVIMGWILCLIFMLYLVYGLHKTQLSTVMAATYSSLSHTAWAVGLSWIVIACTTGHGGYANRLLSSRLLIPFSRTTYCAYLIHPIIIRWVVMRRDSPVHLAEETIAVMFLGQLVASYILAFMLSITFEAPIVSLLKIISPTKRNKLH